jgi:ribosomal-protein-alanine N-acetyltransferase
VFTLETPRLVIRPLAMADLEAAYRLLDPDPGGVEAGGAVASEAADAVRAARARWLQWTVLGYEQFARLRQPPYGERAMVLKASGELAGLCGFVPLLLPLAQMPPPLGREARGARSSTGFGLYYAVAPAHRRQGLASEAAAAMVGYAFGALGLDRILATTTYDNLGSQGVMRRLGMQLLRNPFPDPPWLQVVGVMAAPAGPS